MATVPQFSPKNDAEFVAVRIPEAEGKGKLVVVLPGVGFDSAGPAVCPSSGEEVGLAKLLIGHKCEVSDDPFSVTFGMVANAGLWVPSTVVVGAAEVMSSAEEQDEPPIDDTRSLTDGLGLVEGMVIAELLGVVDDTLAGESVGTSLGGCGAPKAKPGLPFWQIPS